MKNGENAYDRLMKENTQLRYLKKVKQISNRFSDAGGIG
jgi:hypothetical protein